MLPSSLLVRRQPCPQARVLKLTFQKHSSIPVSSVASVSLLLFSDDVALEHLHPQARVLPWEVPQYAILSHRWEENEELTFGDVTDASRDLKGHKKVKEFCETAMSNGFTYGWVDTCCIDKKSSAELSEAINSMYKWYRNSAVCYAYLMDVGDVSEFEQSSWFTRGWTLQELLAPTDIHFFDRLWNVLATKRELAKSIEARTGIPRKALQQFNPANYCIAFKMSWAARRETTREEDRAYSLLGLFDVNMPLLYGEGSKAFQRLQEEIMRSNTDASIFMWSAGGCDTFGMLAADPSSFDTIHNSLKGERVSSILPPPEGWTSNNAGIRLGAVLHPYAFSACNQELFVLELCEVGNAGKLGVFVIRDRGRPIVPRYIRTAVNGMTCISGLLTQRPSMPRPKPRQLLIVRVPFDEKQIISPSIFSMSLNIRGPFSVAAQERPRLGSQHPFGQWPAAPLDTDSKLYRFTMEPGSIEGILGLLVVRTPRTENFLLLIGFGFDEDLNCICIVLPMGKGVFEHTTEQYVLDAYYNAMRMANGDTQSGSSIVTFQQDACVFALRLARLDVSAHLGDSQGLGDDEGVVNLQRLPFRWQATVESWGMAFEYRIQIDMAKLLQKYISHIRPQISFDGHSFIPTSNTLTAIEAKLDEIDRQRLKYWTPTSVRDWDADLI